MFVSQPDRPLFIRWGPAISIMVVIFLFSSMPSETLPVFGIFDLSLKKLGHVAGYALLAGSIAWGIGRYDRKAVWPAWLLSVVYAATDELHQSFVPGRNASLVDVGIDAFGAALGLMLFMYFRLRSSR